MASDAIGDLAKVEHKQQGMYDPEHWSGMEKRRWAMTIDLARCTGCSACVTACYAENNIPTVARAGRDARCVRFTARWQRMGYRPGANILKGREMAWLRIESYFEGGEDGSDDFETRFLRCCVSIAATRLRERLSVFATYHAPDGLKCRCTPLRRHALLLQRGPYKSVTSIGTASACRSGGSMRSRSRSTGSSPRRDCARLGVMEKCTFCVQRIREAENRARLENREIQPDEFTVACAQACPSRAILFGDAADSQWAMARTVEDARRYHVFEELNTYTAVVYLKKVTHPRDEPNAPRPATPGAAS